LRFDEFSEQERLYRKQTDTSMPKGL